MCTAKDHFFFFAEYGKGSLIQCQCPNENKSLYYPDYVPSVFFWPELSDHALFLIINPNLSELIRSCIFFFSLKLVRKGMSTYRL